MSYDYGCLMINFPKKIKWNKFVDTFINEEDVYNDKTNQYGKEYEPHCTIMYGFDKQYKYKDILKFITISLDKIKIYSENIDIFECDEYDVVKFNLISDDLRTLNQNIQDSDYKITNDFPDYNPHATICYVKKGMGKKYVRTLKNKISFKPYSFSYSHPTEKKTYFKK